MLLLKSNPDSFRVGYSVKKTKVKDQFSLCDGDTLDNFPGLNLSIIASLEFFNNPEKEK